MTFSFYISPLGALILLVFLLVVLIQLFYYLYYYLPVMRKKSTQDSATTVQGGDSGKTKSVSVIVYSQNESDLIPSLVDNLFKQEYEGQFEVIVINDASTDDTRDVVEQLQNSYPSLRLCTVPIGSRSPNRKKLALSIAMKAAQYDLVLHTEANALPQSPFWIAKMVEPINRNEEVSIVVGGYSYEKKNSFGDWFIHFDHLLFSFRYLSLALRRQSFIGVGKNLCYKKSLFSNSREFSNYLNITSGDDDLFVNQIANSRNCRAMVSPSAWVIAHFQNNGKAWKYHKRNHFLSSNFLSSTSSFIFMTETITRYLFWTAFALGVATHLTNIPVLSFFVILFLVRIVVQQRFFYKASKLFSTYWFGFSSLFYELYQPIVNLFFWLGRKRTLRHRRL